MTETPVLFGPSASLLGILTRPHDGAPSKFAFLTFNAGVLPRIGPHRLNVKLARALADDGQTSFRFDLSGQGDSMNAVTDDGFRTQAVRDLRDAMDHLQHAFGIQRFALIGVCSGAVNAYSTALVDPRVSGLLMFDGYWCRSRWTGVVRDWKRFRSQPWFAIPMAVVRRVRRALVPSSAGSAVPARDAQGADLENVSRPELVRSVQALVDRGVATFFVYSGSVIDYYSYANQFRDAFRHEPFLDKVRCDYCPDIDHTFVPIAAQNRMIEVVKSWVPEVQRASERRL